MDYAEIDQAFLEPQNENYYNDIINDICPPPTAEVTGETEHFHGDGESSTGVKFWNGQVVRNNITTDKMERFCGGGDCSCKNNTYLLILILILVLLILYKK